MASIGGVEALMGALEAEIKKALKAIFEYVLKNLRYGRPGNQVGAENFAGGFVEGTTSDVALQEFTVAHNFERAPYLVIPVLDPQSVGSAVVPLEVTRAADAHRIYLKSTEESIPITLYVEA